MSSIYSFIVAFRGGTYCSQVEAENLETSLQGWLNRIREDRDQIQHLGDKTLEEISRALTNPDDKPVLLDGLKNFWFMHLMTFKGFLHVHIIKTDVA